MDKDGSRVPPADVAPLIFLPSRVVTPPDASHTRQLFRMGASSFEEFLTQRGM